MTSNQPKYNPTFPNRHSIRLKGYDYSQSGMYFITICVQKHTCLFGKIMNGEMILNNAGKIVDKCWLEIPQHYPKTIVHHYVVMPNHIHGIIEIMRPAVGVEYFRPATMVENIQHDVRVENIPLNVRVENIQHDVRVENIPSNVQVENIRHDVRVENIRPLPPRPKCESGSVGAIVRGFKIGTTKQFGYSIWQRNYWENIIRDEQSYQHIANYIINNPKSWENDRFYSE